MGIFEPFRVIGYITSAVPFSVRRSGTETYVTVSVGKGWQTYDCSKLNLLVSGRELPKKIRALASFKEFVFAAYGNEIAVFRRLHQIATWSSHEYKINMLLLLGDYVISVDAKGNLFIWSLKSIEESLEPVGHIFLGENFTPSCIMHPDTYLNKVVIGGLEGSLELWNISTKTMLYEFKGWNSPVHCCVSSPALDVVAVGCADGTVHVHNLRHDEEIVSFQHSARGSVTSLSFRTDGQPLLASGGSSGVISIWNLEKRRLHSVIREAHDGSILSLHFFANEPVLMSSASDNSIKMWIFDSSDGEARLLRFRSGHSAPPLCLRFYGQGRNILSAGQDRAFRLFSVVQDRQSRELSQRQVNKRAKKRNVKPEEIKLKPVIAFDFAEIRQRDWCNVVTCHMDTPTAYVWSLQNFVLGEHILSPSAEMRTPIKCCAISTCGNFAILGTEGGWVERFNLQSGFSRGSYLDISEPGSRAHDGEVIGVVCSATNSVLISAGYSGDVKVWGFKERELQSRLEVGRPITKVSYHRGNGLLATVADDMIIRLFDIMALRMVRKFEGHTDRVTDFCFSEDGKWLLSASMDGTLRIWDVILARQIDAMYVDMSITSLSLSPNMEILATSHVDQNGVYLWVNQGLFSGFSDLKSYASGEQIQSIELPSVPSVEAETEGEISHVSKSDLVEMKKPATPFSCIQIPDLITLSMLPKSQWQSLTNLDIIKLRNKPIEPPKKLEKAPFFLPSIPSLSGEIVFIPNTDDDNRKGKNNESDGLGRLSERSSLPTQFAVLLQSCFEVEKFSQFTDHIKKLSPAALDMELRMLQIIDEEDLKEPANCPEVHVLEQLLDYFIYEISARNNFEFIQATLKLFLKIHGETVRRLPVLQKKAKKLLGIQSSVWSRVDKLLQSTRCVVSFLSNAQM